MQVNSLRFKSTWHFGGVREIISRSHCSLKYHFYSLILWHLLIYKQQLTTNGDVNENLIGLMKPQPLHVIATYGRIIFNHKTTPHPV